MKFLALPILLAATATPASALTWAEFWEPFTEDHHHHVHVERNTYYHHVPKRRHCFDYVQHEEYIPGDYSRSGRYRPGWVRRWTERVPVRCRHHHHHQTHILFDFQFQISAEKNSGYFFAPRVFQKFIMTHYKPYSPEWHRYRNLKESIESYLNEYVASDVICADILDILEDRRATAEGEVSRMTDMIDQLNQPKQS